MEENRLDAFSYDFLDDDLDGSADEGIFFNKKDPPGSYGDPAAIADLLTDGQQNAHIQMTIGSDGIPAPVSGPGLNGVSGKVDETNMVCLHGPCDWYVERLTQTGQKPDGTPATVTERYCTRLQTWAEPTKLDEADILACSGHSLGLAFPENISEIQRRNTAAISAGNNLGVCYNAACCHYVMLVRNAIESDGKEHVRVKRFCVKLAGAARLKEVLSYQPVHACTGLKSGTANSIARLDAERHSLLILEESRRLFAARKGQ